MFSIQVRSEAHDSLFFSESFSALYALHKPLFCYRNWLSGRGSPFLTFTCSEHAKLSVFHAYENLFLLFICPLNTKLFIQRTLKNMRAIFASYMPATTTFSIQISFGITESPFLLLICPMHITFFISKLVFRQMGVIFFPLYALCRPTFLP